MRSYFLHPEAKADINDIYIYLLQRNHSAALNILNKLTFAFEFLTQYPTAGIRRDFLASDKIRFKVVDNYWIAYSYSEAFVHILLVFDGRREPRLLAALLRERDS